MNSKYIHNETVHNCKAAGEVLPYIYSFYPFDSVIDVGCGLGTWAAVAEAIGATRVMGIDGVITDERMLKIRKDQFLIADLSKPILLSERFDLAICLEVAEHLPEKASDILIETLCNISDVILFSAAIPHQGGQNHLNEQWTGYWEEKFQARKYFPYDILRKKFWENSDIEWWYRQNMIVYAKTGIIPFDAHHPIDIIHPELFKIKQDQIFNMQKSFPPKSIKQRVRFHIKSFVRSIMKK